MISKYKEYKEYKEYIFLIILAIISAILCLIIADRQTWYDEIFSVFCITHY